MSFGLLGKICRPKNGGGLNFQSLGVLNDAYMMKIAWQMEGHLDKLWVQILRKKYVCSVQTIPKLVPRSNASTTWRVIVNSWPFVEENMSWVIRDGKTTRFWSNRWIPKVPCLSEVLTAEILVGELNFTVSSYGYVQGWDWRRLSHIIPS